MRYALTVCAIFRNEAPFLAEWLAFHRVVGVEHFYLFDNCSTDAPERVLAPHIAAGRVSHIPWTVDYDRGAQRLAYEEGIRRARGEARWVAFIDVDEFLFSPAAPCLTDVLDDFQDCPGVAVHWQVYGSGGLVGLDGRLVTEALVRRAPTQWVRNRRVKLIVDPERTLRPESAHQFVFTRDAPAVNERREPLRYDEVDRRLRALARRLTAWAPRLPVDPYATRTPRPARISVDRLRINHYVVKTRTDWLDKTARFRDGRGDGQPSPKYDESFFRYHDRNEIADPVVHRFLPAVRRLLA